MNSLWWYARDIVCYSRHSHDVIRGADAPLILMDHRPNIRIAPRSLASLFLTRTALGRESLVVRLELLFPIRP
jgi:hypothetical protein